MNKFEFIIDGPPVSQQARRREKLRNWRAYVRQEAEKYWSTENKIFKNYVMVEINYFYEDVALDIDNIIKPILDAIIGLVYLDDDQITDIIVRKRNVLTSFKTGSTSSVLTEGFIRKKEFLYVVVTLSPYYEVIE